MSAAGDALYQEALALYERDDFAAAAPRLEALLAQQPGHVEARYKLGNVRKAQGDLAGAARHYRTLLEREPGHAEALNNLGAVCQAGGDDAQAERCYRQALQHKPGLAQPYLNLGRLLQAAGRDAEAAGLYRSALAQGLDAEVFGHLLAAAQGASSARAPEGYVRETFDAFAPEFEQRLGELGYRVPQRLAVLAAGHGTGGALDVLDLGCGTGLVGDALAAAGVKTASLVGVDLSGQMLESARRKQRYTTLHQAEILGWLASAPEASSRGFDLAVAADVFIYIGDLAPVFQGLARCLRRGGLLALSVELCEGASYRLLASGRYAQSPAYLAALAARWGLRQLVHEALEIRSGVAGEVWLLRLE